LNTHTEPIENQELVALESFDMNEIFQPNGLDVIIDAIENIATNRVMDVTTTDGKAEIRSMAHNIARAKVKIDNAGKDMVADMTKKVKAINSERKRGRERLEALQEKTRRPLTEFENKEKERVAEYETALVEMAKCKYFENDHNIRPIDIELRIDFLRSIKDHDWEEFKSKADEVYHETLKYLSALLEERKQYESDQAELEQLRAKEKERQVKDQQAQFAADAAAQVTADMQKKVDAAEVAKEAAERQAADLKAQATSQRIADALKVEQEKNQMPMVGRLPKATDMTPLQNVQMPCVITPLKTSDKELIFDLLEAVEVLYVGLDQAVVELEGKTDPSLFEKLKSDLKHGEAAILRARGKI